MMLDCASCGVLCDLVVKSAASRAAHVIQRFTESGFRILLRSCGVRSGSKVNGMRANTLGKWHVEAFYIWPPKNINDRVRIRFSGLDTYTKQRAATNRRTARRRTGPLTRQMAQRHTISSGRPAVVRAYVRVVSTSPRTYVLSPRVHASSRHPATPKQRAREAAKAGGDETARQVARRLPATRPTPNADGASGPKMRIELALRARS